MAEADILDFKSSSSLYPSPRSGSVALYCIIQGTITKLVNFGIGLYAKCEYIASINTFRLTVPGGLTIDQEYLVTIIDRDQLLTSFDMPTTPQRVEVSLIYTTVTTVQHRGDVFTLDFPGMMTTYNVEHMHTYRGQLDMLAFRFKPDFALPASLTSGPITESVLSFEVDSNYYDDCLSIQNVFAGDGMTFYNGAYFSHYSEPAVSNANTRILCGQNT